MLSRSGSAFSSCFKASERRMRHKVGR